MVERRRQVRGVCWGASQLRDCYLLGDSWVPRVELVSRV